MATDMARQAELRQQMAKEMADALGVENWKDVQSALESSLDMHHAHIEEEASSYCHKGAREG